MLGGDGFYFFLILLKNVNALRCFFFFFSPQYALGVFVILNLEYKSGLSKFFGFTVLVSSLDFFLTLFTN